MNLKPTHKPVREYYAALEQFDQLGVMHEIAAPSVYIGLLGVC